MICSRNSAIVALALALTLTLTVFAPVAAAVAVEPLLDSTLIEEDDGVVMNSQDEDDAYEGEWGGYINSMIESVASQAYGFHYELLLPDGWGEHCPSVLYVNKMMVFPRRIIVPPKKKKHKQQQPICYIDDFGEFITLQQEGTVVGPAGMGGGNNAYAKWLVQVLPELHTLEIDNTE
mmetsp:Transcript_43785/g.49462  ORF Transcript_43785/g.49462 Transcript_43785/m.49462 type:complete len:177 (+) Transcript_43785:24-554(+)